VRKDAPVGPEIGVSGRPSARCGGWLRRTLLWSQEGIEKQLVTMWRFPGSVSPAIVAGIARCASSTGANPDQTAAVVPERFQKSASFGAFWALTQHGTKRVHMNRWWILVCVLPLLLQGCLVDRKQRGTEIDPLLLANCNQAVDQRGRPTGARRPYAQMG